MTDRAATLTYFAMMSLFPALLVGVTLLGLLGQQGLVALLTRPCWPSRPSRVTPTSSAGNSDIIAKYVSVAARSVI